MRTWELASRVSRVRGAAPRRSRSDPCASRWGRRRGGGRHRAGVTSHSAEERARLFVALELPVAARDILARWRAAALRETPVLRPVPLEHLHVTLCFLGSRPVREIDAIAAACGAAAG